MDAVYGNIQLDVPNTQATDLLRDKNCIFGVAAKHFGQKMFLNTKNGVVTATGGSGAVVINFNNTQLHPCGTPDSGLMENIRTSDRNRIFVNKVRCPSRYWVGRCNGATIRDTVALGAAVEADTLDEPAKKTGMKPENLKASIDNYNKILKGEIKDPLGFKADNKADTTLTEEPWYACKKVPTVHHTTSGIHGSNRLAATPFPTC